MDRQSLLEQKRQRLEELRKKRSAIEQTGPKQEPTSDDVEDKKQDGKITVDAAVQAVKVATKPVIEFSEINRFSKGIQTDKYSRDDTEKVDDLTVPETSPVSEPKPVQIDSSFDEQTLNKELQQSIKLLHEVFASTGLENGAESKYNMDKDTDPIYVINEVLPLPSSTPVLFDTSPQPGEFIVSFRSAKYEEYPGLAVIFHTVNNKIIPVHFLASLSPISQIKFAIFDSRKVIGGLKNGKVVVWEITDDSNEAVMLPTLISPNSYSNKALHRNTITAICQFPSQPNVFMTTCLDGKINLWSVNFLEYPKFETIWILNDPEQEDSMTVLDKRHKPINHAVVVQDVEDSLQKFNYLNSIVIGTSMGTIHRLNNDPKSNYISSSIETNVLGSLNLVGTKDETKLLASTNHDCNINLFDNQSKILTLPTSYIALGICKRPKVQFQFISFGLYDELRDTLMAVVDLWDLNKSIRKPICSIGINSDSHPVSGEFDTDGNQLFLGFNDGKISVFQLDSIRIQNFKTEDTIHDII